MKKKIAILTGAGISAESGLKTFRDSGGLWEGHDVTKVATPEAWRKDRALVLEFYNQRRKQALSVVPNPGHFALAELEEHFNVVVITQNIDALHEKAGSTNVLHLHGEISKVRSTLDPELIYELDGWELKEGDKCAKGSQLRPHIVWFGEPVPMMEPAMQEALSADIFLVAGTSLVVYPAAGLLDFISSEVPKFVIDPKIPDTANGNNFYLYEEPASTGLPKVKEHLIKHYA
ncbi:SIR2 family NAD-dependent protein deacylase [Ekhidna sp.]|uniref:SIR2 family NAD-dependent protein deacylase n=1 Tax=Ekhidna sp. TaxID=2608089 RepID=UPI003C7CADBD